MNHEKSTPESDSGRAFRGFRARFSRTKPLQSLTQELHNTQLEIQDLFLNNRLML